VSTRELIAKLQVGLNEVKNSVGMNHTLRKSKPRRLQCGS